MLKIKQDNKSNADLHVVFVGGLAGNEKLKDKVKEVVAEFGLKYDDIKDP